MDLTEGVGESSSRARSFGSFSNYDVRNDVYNRLVESGHEEAVSNRDFLEQLDAHFSRLPPSYGFDVNLERVEDVLLHQKLLALAIGPENRHVYHIRFLEGSWSKFSHYHSVAEKAPVALSKLGDWEIDRRLMNLEERNASGSCANL